MHDLIDGYNLLHAMGLIPGRLGPAGLEKVRLRLLGLLAGAYGPEGAGRVTVVFDAAGAPPGATEVQEYKGIRVRFAVRQPEADDLIESLIGHDSAPKQLRVISDDHRIRQAARQRRCEAVSCGEYLDWLARHRGLRRSPPAPEDAKPAAVSESEARLWLQEFGGLEEDPEFKEFFNMDRFEIDDAG